jgi:hypothetical protein
MRGWGSLIVQVGGNAIIFFDFSVLHAGLLFLDELLDLLEIVGLQVDCLA